MTSPRFVRLTGLVYLTLAIIGGFAFFTVSETLYFRGDASATAMAITANESLFRWGIAAYWIILGIDVLLAWMLFRVFRDHAPDLAILAAWFRLAYVAIHGAAILELTKILALLDGAMASQSPTLRTDLIQHYMQAHLDGFLLSLIIFGLHLNMMGWIIIRTRPLPAIIGGLVMLAGSAYIIDGMAFILLEDYAAFYAATQIWIAIIATVGEVSFLLWLLVRGIRAPIGRVEAKG